MIAVRKYGDAGPRVVLLHGGPGAVGEMEPVARELTDEFHVIEPLQRASGETPLTVAVHVEDLREVVEACGADLIVGFSWGAMLALVFAAEHPALAKRLVLIGCGTFDLESRARLHRNRKERKEVAALPADFDVRGHDETWASMFRPPDFLEIRTSVILRFRQ